MPTIHSKQDPSNGSGIFVKYPRISGFTILEHLHEGSHSSIYKARQDRLGRIVAIKLVPEWPPPTDVALERFNRAAYVCAHTPSNGLCTLFDTGAKDSYYFATYTFLEGQTLQRLLGMVGQVDEGIAIQIGLQVARTLAALHANQICHRNIKPKNIFLENNGNVRVIGLGLASCKSAFFSPHLDTHAIGTPHFMAPEMIKGVCSDPRSDLYSLGVTLYVILAGRPPYDRGIPAVVMSRHLTDTPVNLKEIRPDVSSKLVALIDALMVKDPAKRIQTANDAVAQFEVLARKTQSSMWKLSPAADAKQPASPVAAAVAVQPVAAARKQSFRGWLRTPLGAGLSAGTACALLLGSAWYAVTQLRDKMPVSTPSKSHQEATPIQSTQPWKLAPINPAVDAAPLEETLTVQAKVQNDAAEKGPIEAADSAIIATRECARLLKMTPDFERSPDAGLEAWSGFLAKYPDAPKTDREIAQSRVEIYRNMHNNRNVDTQPARRGEFEF
jgi:serine/threonine protein kinase